ncbi:MAG: TlyA family RNA methyltransferase [Chloroflexi bacterium]|nr:TlyA family RNA methyltransferase [Anaerolineaceae bacterium]NMB89878.1 TlyA family RNA methyltransferase [Chloroflexota bacterium]
MEKIRLDVLLTERGLADSRALAQRLVMAGQVRVNGQVVIKPASKILATDELSVDHGPRYVSRGGEKLEGALVAFDLLDLQDKVCADVGASTGGFTDCLLQHGARKVYAIDVGYGVLHWKLRNDPRVVSMERTNARFVGSFPEAIELVTIDASFISLKVLLPVARGWFTGGGRLVALIKPQFEAGRAEAARGEGVIRDAAVHRRVLEDVLAAAEKEGFGILGLARSPLLGPKGNVEFLAHLAFPGEPVESIPVLIDGVLEV